MAVQFGAATLPGSSGLSATARLRQVCAARFQGNGVASLAARLTRQTADASFLGAGSFSINVRMQRHHGDAIFAGSGTLSAFDSIISMSVSFLSSSSLQAIADRSLAELMSNSKTRLVVAVEVGILPIN